MKLSEANEIIRKAIIKEFFKPELTKFGFKESKERHPFIGEDGLTKDGLIHLYFDTETGNDYPDGDEWFIVEFLIPKEIDLPDKLKSPDYFTSLAFKGKRLWRHRELVRYRYGKIKRLDEAIDYIIRKAEELSFALKEAVNGKKND